VDGSLTALYRTEVEQGEWVEASPSVEGSSSERDRNYTRKEDGGCVMQDGGRYRISTENGIDSKFFHR
jgi:hypothetical protein